uniref:Cilia and flagella associated protein 144 n=1 Tax=Dicentrarchus labrax TaxID=13489 RepID=A0A8C4HYR1_DICLA
MSALRHRVFEPHHCSTTQCLLLLGNKLDLVHQNAIHVETIRKEQRHQKLHTEFNINPCRKLHVLPDKPMSRKQTEVIAANSDFIEAFHKARQEPTKKYKQPQTESQEIGWISTPLIPSNRNDMRYNFYRFSTDVTIHKEYALRSSN